MFILFYFLCQMKKWRRRKKKKKSVPWIPTQKKSVPTQEKSFPLRRNLSHSEKSFFPLRKNRGVKFYSSATPTFIDFVVFTEIWLDTLRLQWKLNNKFRAHFFFITLHSDHTVHHHYSQNHLQVVFPHHYSSSDCADCHKNRHTKCHFFLQQTLKCSCLS